MSYLDDDDDVPFFFELEVDDEISFKAPQMATKKTVPVKRIETSRSSFAMPQFSVRNLVTSSELFKSTEADSFFDKENNPKSTQSCNTAEKPKLPPSSAEKLMRYSVDSAVSFIENFSSMIPRDLPSFSTIAEGADESVEDPNAEDCDLSEAEISEYRCAGRMRGGKFTESEFNFQLGSTNNKDDNDIDGLASLIGSASNDNSIDCRHDVPTKKNINTNSNKDDDCNEDEEDACEDKSFKSESCESYDTASEDAAAIKQKGINTDKIVLPTTNKTTNQDQEKMSAGEEAVKGAEDGVHGDDVGDVAGDKSAVCAVNNGNHVPTPTPTAVAVTAAAVIPTAIITTTATTTPNEDKLADKDTHASTNKDICVENIDVDNCTTTPAPKHAPAPAAPSVSALIPAIPALAPISAAVVAPSAAALSAVAPLVTVPPVIASPGVPVPSRRMSMIKTLGERKNIPRGEEVEEVVKEDTNTTIKPQEKAEVVAGREGGVVEVEVTTAAEATTDNINQIIDVKKEEVVVKKVQKIEDKVQLKLGVELITDLKSEKMASATAKQNLSDEKNTKNTENIEKADVVVTGEVAEHALLPSKVVTFQETPILIEGEGEDGEGKVNK